MPPAQLEQSVFGIYSTYALHLADRYGLFAHLADHQDATAPEIAEAVSADGPTLERLLLLLTAQHILVRSPAGGFRLADGTRPYLDPREPSYLLGFVEHLLTSVAERMPTLDAYLAKGKQAVDADLPEPFDVLYRTDESTARFLDAMWQLSFHVSHELVALADLGEVGSLLDVGGASGPFSVAALQANPRLRGTVFDLPQVEPHLLATATKFDLTERLDFVGGDFFRDDLPQADCVAFGYILSDWADETCELLLRKAYDACRPGGRVLIMDRLFDADHTGPLATAVMNLSMYFETHGRHRTEAEYLDLLDRAGFTDSSVLRSTGDKHLVVGRRA